MSNKKELKLNRNKKSNKKHIKLLNLKLKLNCISRYCSIYTINTIIVHI